jgi:predicted transcriptional regulator
MFIMWDLSCHTWTNMIISSHSLKQAILSALADEEIVKILNCSMYRAIPVNNIIKECNIPHTTAYRKINWMLDKGLLLIDKIEVTSDGKKYSLVRSILKSLHVRYDYNSLIVEAEYNLDAAEKFTERFLSLK